MKQMTLIEMDGFLKGKCIPSDLKVNETNAEYLVRKFAEAEAKCAALAAENAGLKAALNHEVIPDTAVEAFNETAIIDHDWNDTSEWSWVENDTDVIRAVLEAIKPETPATDAFLAEIERKAIRKFINSIEHILRDKLSPYDTEEMLETMRIFLEEQGGEQK
ncbi:TPA: hypothetical protein JN717_003116 [Shigella flexneri]|uniref:hypothetical protein n=1 Tax=Shigella flexneri TaxID=623 RepID=UPI000DA5913E|nr:hypothetical protein [Shigella flexneri]EFF1278611.1 hypothetical protein [Escherichia coli]HAY9074511.1 hypothetical protein [Shigella boydii]EAA2261104.1 hypothetical protein [Shigella flexneri]EAA4550577.1 hypothetical protein [Shigella flexneri]EFF3178042.1 hypothetical protein [Escherichia coli]